MGELTEHRPGPEAPRALPVAPFAAAYLVPLLHVAALALARARGEGLLWLLPLYVFVAMPVLDRLRGTWTSAASDGAPRNRRHDLLLELWAPTQLATLAWSLRWISEAPPSPLGWVAFALSLGLVTGGIGINVAHELMHRPGRMHRALAEVLMTSTLYAHFQVEHVLGHHRHVGTRQDPATARRGEALYAFLARCVLTGVADAWRLEQRRVARHGGAWTPADRRVRYALTQSALIAGLWLLAGPIVLGAFLAQAFVAVFLLELVNYVEHYGLERELRPDGRPVRVAARHSWNSEHAVSSAHLFLLPRHSHHHAEASRPYDQLRPLEGASELPAGYPTMMLAALVPPLWFRWMDPRVAAVQARPESARTA
ncbi:MAG: alkane 1-monooxygenase [Planctomycetota bacterium]